MPAKRESRLELAAKYRNWADEAGQWQADAAGLREDYLKLAVGWLTLADEISDDMSRVNSIPAGGRTPSVNEGQLGQ
jgi:hypothetical protein